MGKAEGRLYFRKIEIVDDSDNIIYRQKDISIRRGIHNILSIIEAKDGKKTLKSVFYNFSKYLDNEFKVLFQMEESNGKNKEK